MMHVTWDTGILWYWYCLVMKYFPIPPSNSYQFLTPDLFFWLLMGWTDVVEELTVTMPKSPFGNSPLKLVTGSVCREHPSVHYCGLPALSFVCCLTAGPQLSTGGPCPCGSEQCPQPCVSPCTYFVLLVSGDVQAFLSVGGLAWTLWPFPVWKLTDWFLFFIFWGFPSNLQIFAFPFI